MKKSLLSIFAFVLFSCVQFGQNNNGKLNELLVINEVSPKKLGIATDSTFLSKTSEMLEEDKFWLIIDHSLKKSSNQEEQEKILIQEIEQLSPKEMIGFRLRTDKLLYDTYTSEIWCAGYMMNGGCSDDGFEYFRCWIISRGKNAYYKTKLNPDYLINEISEDSEFYDFESFWYVALTAFKNKTGKELYDYIDNEKFKANEGNYPEFKFTWEENNPESMRIICPKLYQKFMK
ncbi:DUF4240 domain-containing protein [Flavobacterium nackdongense]|uniref:DUF4240 domain-containing protein n=1 Tax=Flavobacterium nackdongense TaxID=2547394 RepID=A0A4P6Y5Y8_9FLAO|nr:DUF4240 domain-containing protein [Flavobacterium nackdongense]QBN17649.1 DUF4240 domain-containing protein [Flavobacterium nackdongense]